MAIPSVEESELFHLIKKNRKQISTPVIPRRIGSSYQSGEVPIISTSMITIEMNIPGVTQSTVSYVGVAGVQSSEIQLQLERKQAGNRYAKFTSVQGRDTQSREKSKPRDSSEKSWTPCPLTSEARLGIMVRLMPSWLEQPGSIIPLGGPPGNCGSVARVPEYRLAVHNSSRAGWPISST